MAVLVTVTDRGNGTGADAVFSGTDADKFNFVYFSQNLATGPIGEPPGASYYVTRQGDGTVAMPLAVGSYAAYALFNTAGATVFSEPFTVFVTAGTASGIYVDEFQSFCASSSIFGRSIAVEDTPLWLFMRFYLPAGTAITSTAQISTITYSVYDLSAAVPTVVTNHSAVSVTPSAVLFSSLQTSDARWTKDTTGYNFRHLLAATAFPLGGRRYRVEYTVTPLSGSAFVVPIEVDCQEVAAS